MSPDAVLAEAAPPAAATDASALSFHRACVTGFAAACDIVLNYPLWIVGKRLSAGMSLPVGSEMYKGGGALWCSTGPTIIVEDYVTEWGKGLGMHPAASACASGAFAGALVSAQVENCITRSHASGRSLLCTVLHIQRTTGTRSLLLPHGMSATALREIPFAGSLFFLREKARDAYLGHMPSYAAEGLASITAACVGAPLSHPFCVLGAYQQAYDVPFVKAVRNLGVRDLMRGVVARTASICGTMLVVPLVMEHFA